MNGHYVFYQPNSHDTRNCVGDCSIRAFCKFFNISWVEAFDWLCEAARTLGTMPNQIRNIKVVMKMKGHIYHRIGNEPKTVDEFVTVHGGKYMLLVKAKKNEMHVVTCRNHYYYDTWDSGKAKIVGYWKKGGNAKE